ncbi:MAG: MFS transporter [Candidatus Bathyarchaeia archaeon]|nr:MFS transporter [Candidatus Bathyarchaeia archaeon]
MNQVRVVIFIQILNSFVSGILGIALPLMMKERNIDIVTIGLVFASLTMIFQLGRLFFATVSDFWGRTLFFVLNGFLGVISSEIYYLARTPLEFVFGKVMEGTKDGSLWAVNRALLLEKTERKWRILVHLRTAVYVSYAVGSLLAGFFIVWLFYEGTLMLCALVGAFVFPTALLLVGGRKKRFSVAKALHFLDFRKKEKVFKRFLILFFVMGLSFGFRSGFVFPLFLSANGFDAEIIGMLLGLQVLLAGSFSYLFARRFEMEKLILLSGMFYTFTLVLLGFSSSVFAGILVIVYGAVEGLLSIGQEGILSRITNEESYGIDIGLLMMGLHSGNTLSLALSGFLISMWGFVAPFLMSAVIFAFFYVTSYVILKE